MVESIYKVGECDYCGEVNNILRPTPFMGDIPAMMCEYCWEETRKEYVACNGEYIGKFDECEGYEQAKDGLITDGKSKDLLSDPDNEIDRLALQKIEELEKAIDGLNRILEDRDEEIKGLKDDIIMLNNISNNKNYDYVKLQSLNRDLVELIASVVRTYDMQEEFGKLCNADKSLMENFNTDWIVVEKNWIEKARALLEKAEGVE